MLKTNNQNGFIPMIIMLVLFVAAVVWFVYERVASSH
jgi:F0F1-type ATP synthase membrane subunit b/b'